MGKKFSTGLFLNAFQILNLPSFILFVFLSFHSIFLIAQAPEETDNSVIENGKDLFTGNCTVCHGIDEVVIGPALRDVHERKSEEWIYSFIKNSQKVIQSGDEYAVNLYNEYNKTLMTSFDFNDEELNSIVEYIKAESSKPIEILVADESIDGGSSSELATSVSNTYVNFLSVLVVISLFVTIIVLIQFNKLSKQYILLENSLSGDKLSESDKEFLEYKFDYKRFFKSDFILGATSFLFTIVFVRSCIDGLYTVGIQQNYQPTQPIAFSHKIHAGQFEIDCNYCHTGVRNSKSANIPSVNICMNCHNSINTEKPEIQKILTAYEEKKPIEWIRVHNLPDLSYFNHSQHVEVGGIECETCHGPIKEMDVVYQYAELTMGWCVNCHRETELNSKGNEYYDKLVALHGKNSKNPLKVQDIGGLECSKCHY
mgnify:CR=1 FL=1